ncbi:MAG TPA: hypothetical protein VE987_10140, partial [Polyangiaceae bacterium]|nr:hypothetical protein [Polyangiaceae bacterium]
MVTPRVSHTAGQAGKQTGKQTGEERKASTPAPLALRSGMGHTERMHRTVAARLALAGFALAVWTSADGASAETHATAAAGGGLPRLDVTVDLASASVRANDVGLPIPLERAQLPTDREVVVEPIAVGQDRQVVHVRVPIKGDAAGLAWEAILAGGRAQPIFAGVTGLVAGDPGERTGKAVQIVPAGASSFVLVGDVREDLTLCGQVPTLLDPLALYPASLELRSATVQRLGADEQARAARIVATPAAPTTAPPLARLLVARGSSVPGSRGAELTDGDPQTFWAERRPGAGQGEFVVMAAPRDVPITRMRVTLVPPGTAAAGRAAPKTFYLVTAQETFEVTIPDDPWATQPASPRATSFEISFPQPIEASCVALVLDSAYARGSGHPEVGVAELEAYSEFDAPGATLDDVAKKLSSDRGIAAAQLLERAGDAALAAVERVFDGLDAGGRALAVDVAAAHERCEEAAPLLVRGLCWRGGEAPRKAREKLDRCKGAAPALARSLQHDASARACVAPTLATIAPLEALEP